jgi:hypothetical protein
VREENMEFIIVFLLFWLVFRQLVLLGLIFSSKNDSNVPTIEDIWKSISEHGIAIDKEGSVAMRNDWLVKDVLILTCLLKSGSFEIKYWRFMQEEDTIELINFLLQGIQGNWAVGASSTVELRNFEIIKYEQAGHEISPISLGDRLLVGRIIGEVNRNIKL